MQDTCNQHYCTDHLVCTVLIFLAGAASTPVTMILLTCGTVAVRFVCMGLVVAARLVNILENVEHYGGEPEQADTELLCH